MKHPAERAPGVNEEARPPSSRRQTWLARLGKVFRFAAQRAEEQKLLQVASSLTFTTVLAIVPMLAVALSLFTAFPLFQEFRVALEDFLSHNLMPPSVSDNVMGYLNQFAQQASSLTAIGGAFLIVTSVLLIMTIDQSFNDIWHVKRQRPLSQRVLVYWSVITLGPLAAGASLWATSFVARESMGLVQDVPEIVSLAISFIPLLLSGLAFSALFVVVPNRRILWRDALVGGYGTALLLEVMKSAFAYYLTRFPTYTVIYGAFATLPIFLLWLYLSWLAVLFGATVAASLPLIRLGRWEINRQAGAAFIDAVNVLRSLRRAQGGAPVGLSTAELVKQLQLNHDELNDVLDGLEDMGLVARTADQRWILACDPRTTTLAPVFDEFLLDRRQRRVRDDPALSAAVASVLCSTPPSLEELAGQAHNTANDATARPAAAVVTLEAGKK
ncbi:YihY family inner membrane protein [Bordetella genomosp. 13]|uniref:UPF0761 membrane protein CAL15_09790 n=1 Tax=Bordetella genomosp. 13 TaxID=463040 RepID=A0A1W6ZCS4_9BORD|nr:YihY family inner membrane protein [Bordetella genomosp. 13]ARP94654.1 hypothetical protein CAL15_09790 [Bordetella genomosp. 13]